MLFLGMLSFLQVVFIPGFILLRIAGFNRGGGDNGRRVIQNLVYGFGLSLITNYLLVFLFTLLGIYKPLTVYTVLLLEGVLIGYLLKKSPPVNLYLHVNIKKALDSAKHIFAFRSLSYNLLLILSFIVISYYALIFLDSIGTAFLRWDPVHSWNRWALAWAGNSLPTRTWHYPQLLPANWSLSYVIMQNTEVQLFAKFIMGLFSIGILLLFLEIGLRKKNATYLLSLILYGVLLNFIYNAPFIVSGHMDIPVSFFAFLSFHALHIREGEARSGDFKLVWLAVLFASAAAVTKQSGIFILLYIIVWAFRGIYKSRQALSHRQKASRAALLLLTVIIVSASWYSFNEIKIQGGKNPSEILMLQEMQAKNRSFGERFFHGITQIFKGKILTPLVYLIVLLTVLGLFHKTSRGVTLFIVIPYTLIWGFLFSYDTRNLAFVVPFMAFSAAFGTVFLTELLTNTQGNLHFNIPVIPVIISVLAALSVLNFTLLKKENLVRQQCYQRLNLVNNELNEMLFNYYEKEGINGRIATMYQFLKYLPKLGRYHTKIKKRFCKRNMITLKFLNFLDSQKGKCIHYILLHKSRLREKNVENFIRQKINKNKYRLIFECSGYKFVKVRI